METYGNNFGMPSQQAKWLTPCRGSVTPYISSIYFNGTDWQSVINIVSLASDCCPLPPTPMRRTLPASWRSTLQIREIWWIASVKKTRCIWAGNVMLWMWCCSPYDTQVYLLNGKERMMRTYSEWCIDIFGRRYTNYTLPTLLKLLGQVHITRKLMCNKWSKAGITGR